MQVVQLLGRTALLRDFFYKITGPELDEEPYVTFVEDLINILRHTDITRVLEHFGKRRKSQDPVVHFYETFLAAYDPKLREQRGVYYTPDPVVSYIVRSVDWLLKNKFNCIEGLSDTQKIEIDNYDPVKRRKDKNQMLQKTSIHKVLLLDPACGTGTFLYHVIDHIRDQFIHSGDAGIWADYIRKHLLPRIFGFELMMAPYAVAHFKLTLQLAGLDLPDGFFREGYAFEPTGSERIGIFLTNSLEEAHEHTSMPLFNSLSHEADAANEVKSRDPIMVVMGNPPYSGHSANKGKWMEDLIKKKPGNYYTIDGKPLKERNPKYLQDDYVKFIRFGQWKIEQTGYGILAFITNNGYLDNPTFRGMRQSLMNSFSDIYIFNLHGSSKKREVAPDGTKDVNVFDIQQGVAIGIFVKAENRKTPAQIHYADLWGKRKDKYDTLYELGIETTQWQEICPQQPYYLFCPQETDLHDEYNGFWDINEIFCIKSHGFTTHRDHFAIAYEKSDIESKIDELTRKDISIEDFLRKYDLKETGSWNIQSARDLLLKLNDCNYFISQCCYRPFDFRWCFLNHAIMDRPRNELIKNVLNKANLCLGLGRQGIAVNDPEWSLVHAAKFAFDTNNFRRGGLKLYPLYLYPNSESNDMFESQISTRQPNLNKEFIKEFSKKQQMEYNNDGCGDLVTRFGPEDIFHYIYAVFHSLAYRKRYADFLKIDFPRVPLISDKKQFRKLCELGEQLASLHFLEAPELLETSVKYPVPGGDVVEKQYPKHDGKGRVFINSKQYFDGVPENVWEFTIGGYQVCEKWLKDRCGRKLSYDDKRHYPQIVKALQRTIEIMKEIDKIDLF